MYTGRKNVQNVGVGMIGAEKGKLSLAQTRRIILAWCPRAPATYVIDIEGNVKDRDELGSTLQNAASAQAHTFHALSLIHI